MSEGDDELRNKAYPVDIFDGIVYDVTAAVPRT